MAYTKRAKLLTAYRKQIQEIKKLCDLINIRISTIKNISGSLDTKTLNAGLTGIKTTRRYLNRLQSTLKKAYRLKKEYRQTLKTKRKR